MEITATIYGRIKAITESSIRRHLKLEDSDGVTTLPSAKIFEQLALIGIANIPISIARVELSIVIPEVSTTAKNLVYIRRSAEKRKDKAIMKEDKFVQKKTKKQLEKERLGHEEAIRLQ
nr:hypothetical protein [Tanacetum cinerariifolium]